MVKVVLLDRDGVINVDRHEYVKSPAELEIFSYAKEALDRLRGAAYLLYIVSNQSGVGRGLMTESDLDAVTNKLVPAVGPFDGIFYCPHKPDDGCDCRKPLPELLRRALADAKTRGPLSEVWMVGDSPSDIAAGAAAGCRTVLVTSGLNPDYDPAVFDVPPDYIAGDLTEAVRLILTAG
ncbi:MAG: HAD family hydrolase [Candidatus Coatesbacteria bacterium]|nr:MAG: HAD family hydrolase [Candidatus Coatesbacteria bacterium]